MEGTLMYRAGLKIAAILAACGLAGEARGAVYTFSGSPAQIIPDNTPAGLSSAFNFTDTGLTIESISVAFTISGGHNGDLYATLSHDSGGSLVLLNRVGLGVGTAALYQHGYSGGGFNNITLSDDGPGTYGNIHNYGGTVQNSVPTPGATYNPDGQLTPVNPGGGTLTFSSQFGGSNPSGQWTLLFADISSGHNQSTLANWTVSITAVPEPVNAALGVFGGVLVLVFLSCSTPVRSRVKCWRAAVVDWINAV